MGVEIMSAKEIETKLKDEGIETNGVVVSGSIAWAVGFEKDELPKIEDVDFIDDPTLSE